MPALRVSPRVFLAAMSSRRVAFLFELKALRAGVGGTLSRYPSQLCPRTKPSIFVQVAPLRIQHKSRLFLSLLLDKTSVANLRDETIASAFSGNKARVQLIVL
jgi:hypothetical protein